MRAKFAVGWRQVAASLIMMGAGAMIASTYGVVAVPLAREFQPSRMVLMLAVTVMTAGSALMSPILGSLMDRMSLRRLMVMGALLQAAGYVALSFVTSFTQVFVVFGLFMAPANILIGPMAAAVLLSRWFFKRRGAALGIAVSGVALGTVIFPPVIQALLDHYEWRDAFRMLALILVCCTLPSIAMVVNRPADRGLHPDGADADPDIGRAGENGPEPSACDVLTDPTFWMVAATIAIVLSSMIGVVTNLVALAIDQGIKPDKAALLISIYAGAGFVAKLSFAAVADRLNPRHLMFLTLGVFTIGLACLIRADAGYWLIAIGVALVGTGGVMIPLQGLLVPRIFGQHVIGRVSGLLNLVVLCALLTTPPIFGLIFDRTGSYQTMFIILTALTACAILLVPYIRMHQKPAKPEEAEPSPRSMPALDG